VRFLRSASPRAYLSASAVLALLTGLVLHSYVTGAAGALPSASAMASVVVVGSVNRDYTCRVAVSMADMSMERRP